MIRHYMVDYLRLKKYEMVLLKSRKFILSMLAILPCFSYCKSNILHANVPSVVINYSPASSGKYIGSPSITILPNKNYIVSHDLFGPKSGYREKGVTCIFLSEDKGETWKKIAIISPMFWGRLFLHNKTLFILGTTHEYGDLIIRASKDEGKTWTDPTSIEYGLLKKGNYHAAPTSILLHNGYLWASVDRFFGGKWGNFGVIAMRAPINADLLNAKNWQYSPPLRLPKIQNASAWLEGNVVKSYVSNGASIILRVNG
ncbi:MAG: exo-alpha-sialidase, partial [Legionellales bacterium]|nr:exo-alpha-sialidase [Legionellales bacterium]